MNYQLHLRGTCLVFEILIFACVLLHQAYPEMLKWSCPVINPLGGGGGGGGTVFLLTNVTSLIHAPLTFSIKMAAVYQNWL